MEPQPDPAPLIVVVGETGSGKSALAMEIAQNYNGEIIAADSRTVYKGMDIGTAKPTLGERRKVPHHLIDIATPQAPITAADFKRRANQAIADIARRGKLPIMVGGTGLYVDAVIFDYDFAGKANQAQRHILETLSVETLQQKLRAAAIPLPHNEKNKRHLIRQLETGGMVAKPRRLRQHTLIIGIKRQQTELRERVVQRVDAMLRAGLADEVQQLVNHYGWDTRALQTIGYQEFQPYFHGEATLEQTRERIVRNTLQYAKRQRTWFRRNPDIHWICKPEESVDLITTFLNK